MNEILQIIVFSGRLAKSQLIAPVLMIIRHSRQVTLRSESFWILLLPLNQAMLLVEVEVEGGTHRIEWGVTRIIVITGLKTINEPTTITVAEISIEAVVVPDNNDNIPDAKM